MRCSIWESCVLVLFFGHATAAELPKAQPQPGLQTKVTLEIRFKGVPTAKDPSPTVRLVKWPLKNAGANRFTYTEPCWNTKSVCPVVVAATVRVYLSLPWAPNLNVTRFTLCDGSECMLPEFKPLQAKPGEAYKFHYNRVKAVWMEPPGVVTLVPVKP